ncbi:LuxR C-terminal-related transcriptional regulator [Streptomyces subrutilus]|uniref:helix-turn-helix transcriptional regulator n=1 Tax=Streptomyces subrutilus TaxID=36818 RepID=UPI003438054D
MDTSSPARNRRDLNAHLASGVGAALAVAGRGPSVFVVTGGAGAGKSHTLREVLGRIAAPRRQTAVGALADRRPYAVVCDLLGLDFGRALPADADDRLLARLDDLCAATPQVLVVDDAHEADAASLAALNLMASAAADLPLALVVARRPQPEREHLTRLLRRPGGSGGSGTREIVLPPFDAIDLDALVHEQTGRWPAAALRAALLGHRDNALRVTTLLDELGRTGALVPGDRADRVGLRSGPDTAAVLRQGLDEAVATGVDSLKGAAREVARVLAVLARPAAPEELAAVAGMPPIGVVEPVQALLDGGVVALDAAGRVVFVHDSHRDAVDRATPPALRRVLHAAAARHADPTSRLHHVIASGASPEEVLAAVERAGADLGRAPAVEADLLAGPYGTADASAVPDDRAAPEGPAPYGAAGGADSSGAPRSAGSRGPSPAPVPPVSSAAVELAVRRSRALARSGQMRRAEEVARTSLAVATLPAHRVELRRALLFALTLQGKTVEALALIDGTRSAASGHVRDILDEHRLQLVQLGGLEPFALRPPVADPLELTLTGLAAEAVRLCLTGSPELGAELAWEASRRHMSSDVDPYEGGSSDVWPPFIELFRGGPRVAEEALHEMEALRETRAAGWQAAPHQLLGASIALAAGRLDDAAASYDAGLDLAETGELAWTSLSVGARALIDVLRGDLDAADARLRAWELSPGTLQFGIPQPDRAKVALLEARRRYREAAVLARTVWTRAAGQHCYAWLAGIAPDLGRLALRAGDDGLRAMIERDLALLPRPLSPALTPSVVLAEALTGTAAGPDGRRPTAAAAVGAAAAAEAIGEALTEMAAWEEAAVAAATDGDRAAARQYAARALRCADRTGATGVAARTAGRLRAVGVRLGPAAARPRPTSGWAALTPTETQVAALVAEGLSGPGIARRMHISPRTVQTHVSHALAKLGLGSRIELAAAAAREAAPPAPGTGRGRTRPDAGPHRSEPSGPAPHPPRGADRPGRR